MNLVALFWAEVRRELILLVRYPFELVSKLIWNLGFALMIFFGFQSVGGGLPGFEQGQMGRLLGLLITYIAINGIGNATDLIAEETQTGTLEQAALSPPPLVLILFFRDLAQFLENLIRFALVLAIAMALTGVRFHLDVPSFCLLLFLMFLGTEGIGMVLGAAALLYKRVATLSQFAVMLVFGLAVLPLDKLPRWMAFFVDNFPFTKALLLLRQVAIDGVPLQTLVANGAVAGLLVNAAVYLVLGAACFLWAERTARDWGTLNQY
jgi:ABC-2 type transport system permease protein